MLVWTRNKFQFKGHSKTCFNWFFFFKGNMWFSTLWGFYCVVTDIKWHLFWMNKKHLLLVRFGRQKHCRPVLFTVTHLFWHDYSTVSRSLCNCCIIFNSHVSQITFNRITIKFIQILNGTINTNSLTAVKETNEKKTPAFFFKTLLI